MSLYDDDSVVAEVTATVMKRGHSILQIYKYGNDREHVDRLLELFDPPPGRMLDAGCGIGRVSQLMHEARPDLECVLLNVSPAQLALCPDMEKIAGDFHHVPEPDGSFDSVMFCYSLGHGRLIEALTEAARLLRTSGVLFIYDIASDNPDSIKALGYRTFPEGYVLAAAHATGFRDSLLVRPTDATADDFANIMSPETFAAMFRGVRPVAYRFVKEGRHGTDQ